VEKLIYALWRPERLTAEGFRDALVGPVGAQLGRSGARGVQVNVDDGAVADAMLRISTFDEPIAAVVSLWVDRSAIQVRGPLEAALVSVASRIAGWSVVESVPTPPPAVPHGQRQDALWNLAFLRRPADQSLDEWVTRWHDRHTAVAIQTQATYGYVQNLVVRAVTPDTPRVDGIVEEMFSMAAKTDLHAFYGSGGDDAELRRRLETLMASVASIGADKGLDLVPTSRYLISQLATAENP
jgi:hypothetical protein